MKRPEKSKGVPPDLLRKHFLLAQKDLDKLNKAQARVKPEAHYDCDFPIVDKTALVYARQILQLPDFIADCTQFIAKILNEENNQALHDASYIQKLIAQAVTIIFCEKNQKLTEVKFSRYKLKVAKKNSYTRMELIHQISNLYVKDRILLTS